MLQQFFKKTVTTIWGLRVLVNSTIYFEKGLCSFVVRKPKREYAIVLLSHKYYVLKIHIGIKVFIYAYAISRNTIF